VYCPTRSWGLEEFDSNSFNFLDIDVISFEI
jgi:hypothetical protein